MFPGDILVEGLAEFLFEASLKKKKKGHWPISISHCKSLLLK